MEERLWRAGCGDGRAGGDGGGRRRNLFKGDAVASLSSAGSGVPGRVTRGWFLHTELAREVQHRCSMKVCWWLDRWMKELDPWAGRVSRERRTESPEPDTEKEPRATGIFTS